MKIINSLSEFPTHTKPVVVTIGNFDGVHKGHQTVLHHLHKHAPPRVVITFANHPSEVLYPGKTVYLICSLEHRLRLLEQEKIDYVIVLPFTKELSRQSAAQFLRSVKEKVPFNELVLGFDSVMGHDRQGKKPEIQKLSQQLEFNVTYLEQWLCDGEPVSSSVIRQAIHQGQWNKVETYLGRPYSMYGEVLPGQQHGKKLGYPTANLDVDHLSLPPLGVYAVKVKYDGLSKDGVANLGVAPTMRDNGNPLLEVHLFEPTADLYGKHVEVIFAGYIRQEHKFENADALKVQIGKDVVTARQLLSKMD